MILILCHPHDDAARWLHGVWAARGIAPVELVTVEEIAYSRRILHRLTSSGDSSVVQLAGGRSVSPEHVTALVNRVQHVPTGHFARAGDADRAYACEELYAWLLAWLDSFGSRALNRPQPYSLGGGDLHPAAWAHYAAVAGLPTGGWRDSTTMPADGAAPPARDRRRGIVFQHRLYGALLPQSLQEACRRLAVLTGLAVLQVDVARVDDGSGWRFVSATGLADFRAGGWPLASAIASALLRAEATA